MSRLAITGGRVVDPANRIDALADVWIADGAIVALGRAPDGFAPERRIDATGLVVCPGFVDLSARLREPGEERKGTIATESAAAARGGVTTLCCPPDTDPVVDTPAVVELIVERAKRAGLARVETLGALTRGLEGTQLCAMGALATAGCRAVSNAGVAVTDTEVMRRALEYADTFALPVFVRPEDPWLARGRIVHEGAVATRLGLAGIPEVAETIALARELLLVEQTGARVHFSQLSTAPAVQMIRDAIASRLPVTADVAVHHLHLVDADVDGFDSACHVRPPLRTPADRAGLRRGVADGTLAAICSDHQPHDRDAKENPFPLTEPGISGLETLLPLALELVGEDTSLGTVVAALTSGPARVIGVERGRLTPGLAADLCIFDLHAHWVLDEKTMTSRGHNTPFAGRALEGQMRTTILGGRVVYEAVPRGSVR